MKPGVIPRIIIVFSENNRLKSKIDIDCYRQSIGIDEKENLGVQMFSITLRAINKQWPLSGVSFPDDIFKILKSRRIF